ncbi:MAG TPA: DUF3048 domain-containing protein [Acidimicrobiia bacterium]|nr:DUF3048 domain-containing protein [Acidimicrobiia bacterium]
MAVARPGRLRLAARLLGVALLLPACGADFLWVDTMGKKPDLVTTTTTESTTTTTAPAPPPPPIVRLPAPPSRFPRPPKPPPTTAPPPQPKAVPQPGDSPLTGIGIGGYETGHPALVVKIDNVQEVPAGARPQAGINEADVVFEEMVEGGFTRLAAVYHSLEADPVGPIRSARSTDIALLSMLNHPLFAYSGANRDFKKLVQESSMIDVSVDNYPGKYFRAGAPRRSPHNLMSNTSWLHALAAPDAQAPPRLFDYRPPATRPSEPNSKPVARVSASWTYQGRTPTNVSYDWNPAANGWTRIQNGSLHTDAEGRPVTPTNVIFQFVTYHDTGYVDSSGAHVPEADVVGSGDGWFLSAGYLSPVHWVKRDKDDVTEFRGEDGKFARLLPGRTWVELVLVGRGTATDRPETPDDAAKPVAPPPPDGTSPTGGTTDTTATTGPAPTTTTTPPESSTTTTTGPSVTTVTVPPVGSSSTSTSTSSSSTTTTTAASTTTTDKQHKVASTRSESSVSTGPAGALVIGLLLVFVPPPRRRGRGRRRGRHPTRTGVPFPP